MNHHLSYNEAQRLNEGISMKYQTKPGLTTMAIVGIVVAMIAVAGVGYYVFSSSDDEAETSQSTDTTQQQTAQAELVDDDARSLYNAAIAGDAQIRCDFVSEDGGTGTAYIDSETSMRVDVNNTDDGPGHFIRDGDFAYTWTNSTKEGVKINLAKYSQLGANYQTFGPDNFQAQDEEDSGAKVDCKRQSINDDLFTPPSNIAFKELSQTIPTQP